MKFKLIYRISTALLLARWKQTLVAAIGVTFSIAMFVTLLSFMTGLNILLDGLILNRSPHIKLFNEISPSSRQPVEMSGKYGAGTHFIRSVKPASGRAEIYNLGPILESLKNDPDVEGISPKITAQVFYNIGALDMNGVINGIDVEAESKLFRFTDYVTHGKPGDLIHIPNSIILGKAAADKMLAQIGDMVQITTSTGERMLLKVVGFFQSGLVDVDKVQSYASLSTTQKMLGKQKNYVTDIHIRLHDMEKAPQLAKHYAGLFDVEAEDIQTTNSQFETGSRVRSIISYAVGITLLVVAGFGIYNILNMMIYEKMDSIAILKATGFSGRDVKWIFSGIAMSIGIFGGLVGLLTGMLFSYGIDQIPFNTPALPTIKTFPVNYDPAFYLIGGTFSIITTYLAGLFPSRKASVVDPVIIIRGK